MIEVQRTMRAQRLHRIEGAFLVRQIHVGLPNFVARTLPSSALAPYGYVPIGCITRHLLCSIVSPSYSTRLCPETADYRINLIRVPGALFRLA